jgi:hypothetical protein
VEEVEVERATSNVRLLPPPPTPAPYPFHGEYIGKPSGSFHGEFGGKPGYFHGEFNEPDYLTNRFPGEFTATPSPLALQLLGKMRFQLSPPS